MDCITCKYYQGDEVEEIRGRCKLCIGTGHGYGKKDYYKRDWEGFFSGMFIFLGAVGIILAFFILILHLTLKGVSP